MTTGAPVDRDAWMHQRGLEAFERMLVIREVESRLTRYVEESLITGSTHSSVGMEAIAVGVSLTLRPEDTIASTHRGHGHVLARAASPEGMLAELFGRATGLCRGKGGSMHIGSAKLGVLGTNGIVGASIGIATGAALAHRTQGRDAVGVAYFGDGGINQGIFHEALNLASIWKLPCLYVCENNQFAQSASIHEMVNIEDLASRAASYGIPGKRVDGMDVIAVNDAAARAVTRAREGEGPTLIVADTWRFDGHNVGDTEIYRSADQAIPWRERDPVARCQADLQHAGYGHEELGALAERVAMAIDEDEARARRAPFPERAEALTDAYAVEAARA